MSRYQSFKNSEIDWVGEIPSHWETVKPKFKLNRVTRPIDDDDEVVTCFRDGVVTLRKNRRETGFTNSIKEYGYQQIRPGDLVVHEMDGFEGAIGISDSRGKSTPVYTVIEPDQRVDLRYINYLLREMSKTGKIESLARSIRERTTDFRWNLWSEIHFPFPPVEEQKLISRYLDKKTEQIDSLIEKIQNKIKLFKEQRTSLINHYVTKGLDPNVEMKDSGVEWIGEIPKHWDIRKLKHISYVELSSVDRHVLKDEIPVSICHYPNVYKNEYIDESTVLPTGTCSETEYQKFKVIRGDILLTKDSESPDDIGIPTYINSELPETVCGYHLSQIRIKNPEIHSEFAFRFIESTSTRSYFSVSSNGITRFGLGKSMIENTPIVTPPLNEQVEISDYIRQLSEQTGKVCHKLIKKNEVLREYRQSMISSVVTGKVRVTEDMV